MAAGRPKAWAMIDHPGLGRFRPMSEINIVPYVDVMLVLLIIFMVTVPLIQQGVEIDLPEASAETLADDTESEPLIVSVDRHGRFFLNRGEHANRPISAAVLTQQIQMIVAAAADSPVYVRGDRNTDYGHVMTAMVLLQRAGAGQIGLVTQPPGR